MSRTRVTYVAETDSLALYWAEGPAAHATEVAPGVVISFDDDDSIMGIELEGGVQAMLGHAGLRLDVASPSRGDGPTIRQP